MNERKKPLISVIVPVYNVEPYLPTCINTILNQTYLNLEIILIASTSSDNSVEICDEYAKKDPRIVVIHTPPKGLSDARNRGIVASHGEYLCFIDSDDFIAPEFIQTLYNIISEYDCDIAQCDYLIVPESQDTIPRIENSVVEYSVSTYSNKEMLLQMNAYGPYIVMTWNKLYHRSLFLDILFPVGKLHEDVATTYQLYYSAKKIGFIQKPMYFYRQVPTSIMGQPYTVKRLDIIEHSRDMVSYFKKKNEYDILGVALCHRVFKLNSAIVQVHEHLVDSEEIQHALKRDLKETYYELCKHKTVDLTYKCVAFMVIYMPKITNKILLMRRKIHSKI